MFSDENKINSSQPDNTANYGESEGINKGGAPPNGEGGQGPAEKEQHLDDLEKCQKERDEYLNLARQIKADFENYKKDEDKKFAMMAEYANYSFASELVPVLDDIDLASKNAPEDIKQSDWFKGAEAVFNKLIKVLEKEGLKKMEVVGDDFDPAVHESAGFSEIDNQEENKAAEQIKRGYKFKDKLLRPALVKISKKKE